MRVAPLVTITAMLTFAGVAAVQAQNTGAVRKRPTVDISKRSFLDGGTVVRPGSLSSLDYALPTRWFFPTYGAGDSTVVPGRFPLPERFELPGY